LNWDAIGAFGEVIGAAGVIFSLIYLGAQIRSSSKQANADAIYNLQKAQADVMESFSNSPVLAKLFAKLESGQALEMHEDIQVDFIVARVTGIFAAVQASANSGIVGEQYLEDAEVGIEMFATRFRLADKMWRYVRRAHGSVKDGRVFCKIRVAAEASGSLSRLGGPDDGVG